MTAPLKPCPFCGEPPSIMKVRPPIRRLKPLNQYAVVCYNCDLTFGYDEDFGGRFDTEEEATKVWNYRRDADGED